MIHLVYGNKRDKVLARSAEIVDKARKSNSGALYFKFTEDGFDKAKFEDLIGGQSLFSEKVVVLCDSLLDNAEIYFFVLKKAEDLALSGNLFVFREGKLNKKELDALTRDGSKTEDFSTPEDKKGYAGAREVKLRAGYENFNIFGFTDALGARDKKRAWTLYQKGLRAGLPAEELFWKAIWLFKSVILVSSINKNQKDLEGKLKIKPNTQSNARNFLRNYEKDNLFLEKYKNLVDIYHRFRRGEVEAEMATEQFIINL
jgi:DNA polymerase III delta subunit